MERLDIHEICQSVQSTPNRQSTPTIEEVDEWHDLPFRPKKDCEVCAGAGFLCIRDGNRYKTAPCRAPGCMADSVRQSLRGEGAHQTFDNFKKVAGTEKILKAAQALASGEAGFIWLLMYGPTGGGKTHLGNAIIREVRDRGVDVRMILAADFFSQLKEAIADNLTDTLLRRFKEVEFLVIDDYGVEYNSEWELAKFDELMTSRYATARPTVVITNKDLSVIPERVLSRFKDRVMSRICHNDAEDYRETRK